MKRIVVLDEQEPDLRGSKFVPIIIPNPNVVQNYNYFMQRDTDVEQHKITGIQASSFDIANVLLNEYPELMYYNGILCQTLLNNNMAVTMVNFRDKKGRYVFRNTPLQFFLKRAFECPEMLVDLDLTTSNVKFMATPLAIIGNNPIIIPMQYYFDRANIFK